MQKRNLLTRCMGITTFEFSVVILIICSLLFIASRYFSGISKYTDNLIVKTNFRSFTIGVQVAHAQWLMNHQKSIIRLENTTYFFTSQGWPGHKYMDTEDCKSIWNTVLINQIPAQINAPFTQAQDVGVYRMNGLCVYLFRLDLTPPRGIIYNSENGSTMVFGILEKPATA